MQQNSYGYIDLARVFQVLPSSYDGSADDSLQAIIYSCSAFLDNYTNRTLPNGLVGGILAQNHDELYNGTGTHIMYLNFAPVQSISRVATTTLPAISVHNTTADMGCRATVAVTSTGVTLTYILSANTTINTYNFSDYPTIQELANAMNNAGNNWTALAQGGFGTWTSSDLYCPSNLQGAYGARLTTAYLWIHWHDLEWYRVNELTGEIYSPQGFDRGQNNWRVTYVAGYTVFPDDLSQALAELVAATYLNQESNPNFEHEAMNGYSYKRVMQIGWMGLSEMSRNTLGNYKLRKVPKFSAF